MTRPPRRRTWCWTLWAPFYNGAARAFGEMRRRSVDLLALREGEKVLLVGAGTGLDLDLIPADVEVCAVDSTPAMLSRLRARARRLGREVEARIMDAQALELPDASFDAVVLHLILAVVDDPARAAREAGRVLRPGGRAAVLDKFLPDGRRPPFLLRVLNPAARLFGTDVTRQLGPLVEEAGLERAHEEPGALRGFFRIALLRKPGGPA